MNRLFLAVATFALVYFGYKIVTTPKVLANNAAPTAGSQGAVSAVNLNNIPAAQNYNPVGADQNANLQPDTGTPAASNYNPVGGDQNVNLNPASGDGGFSSSDMNSNLQPDASQYSTGLGSTAAPATSGMTNATDASREDAGFLSVIPIGSGVFAIPPSADGLMENGGGSVNALPAVTVPQAVSNLSTGALTDVDALMRRGIPSYHNKPIVGRPGAFYASQFDNPGAVTPKVPGSMYQPAFNGPVVPQMRQDINPKAA